MKYNKVSVIGLGYIGLPTGTAFAKAGLDVVGVDVFPHIVETINTGKAHFGEPNLDDWLSEVVRNGKLRAVMKPEPADAFIVAVPTPFKDDHQPDLAYVEAAARSIAPVLAKGNLIILESTSPVGTTEAMRDWLAAARPDLKFPTNGANGDHDIHIAYCPERVLPGRIMEELVNNARIIGGLTQACAQHASDLYKTFVKGECCQTNARTAEMSKLTENSFRDVNIAFANELSIICDKLDINVWELRKVANLHPRVNILEPGAGVGGHCIAVDPWFIVARSPDEARLIRTAREVNDSKPHFVIDKVREHAGRLGSRPVIACLGLAYKADVDDLRESPAVEIAVELARKNLGEVLVVEPHVDALPKSLAGADVKLVSLDDALAKAAILVLLVDHKPFKVVSRDRLQGKAVVDTRGIW